MTRRPYYTEDDLAFLRLRERDVLTNGYFPALMDALEYCQQGRLPLPDWLFETVWANLDHIYNARKKYWQPHERETVRREKHWERYDLVRDLLDRRKENPKWRYLRDKLAAAKGLKIPQDAQIIEMLAGGVTRETAPEIVGLYGGEPSATVWSSYRKCERALKSGKPDFPARYRASAKKRKKKR
jgi:hypothetical protein